MEDSSSCSSLVPTPSQASFLQRTLERLSSAQCLKFGSDQEEPVAVVALQRYLSERTDYRDEQLHSYSYDVTVTDGVRRVKCFLHASLNHLVHSNTLRTGGDIFISQCSFLFSESRLGHGYMCIEKLRCGRSVVLHRDVPLQLSRKHYLPLWNNVDPEGDMWISGAPPSDAVLDVSKITLIRHLESSRSTLNNLPLLVKVIHKSKLRYYGKFGSKIDYPYMAYFEVADQSGIMSLVLWNELCPKFYQRLNVGTVLYLQNYTLKPSYTNRTRPQMDHHRMKSYNSLEIVLNPHGPASLITVVSPKSVQPQWGLPVVSYRFISRSELDRQADNFACDVIGLVTFVGRVERVKSKVDKEKYWTYRWVHAVDGTSSQPFILELFSSSRVEIFNNICPMTYLVCTQMRVCQVTGSHRFLCQPYVGDPRVKSFIQWTKTLKDNIVLQKTAVGGHYSYPHSPPMFIQSAAGQNIYCRELETLQYREHKRLAYQGQITAVKYLKSPKTPGTEGTEVSGLIFTWLFLLQILFSKEPQVAPEPQVAVLLSDTNTFCLPAASHALSWEGSNWSKQQQELSEHLSQGGLHQDSICRRFTFDEKNALLQWGNLQPSRWSSKQSSESVPPVLCSGYYQLTILGINKQIAVDAAFLPVASSDDPQAVSLPQDLHNNTMLSCLSSGFLCPLTTTEDSRDRSLPEPGNNKDMHVVCILDLCHLGEDKLEVLVNKVYKVAEVAFD
uniref:RPA1 related single stranded DNA binding protein n=1 Tax=Oryzias latipes TaxID=8090 RepID=A0A3P9H9U4_ORYLA